MWRVFSLSSAPPVRTPASSSSINGGVRNGNIREFARKFAEQGYVALAVDLGEGKNPSRAGRCARVGRFGQRQYGSRL